MNDVDWQIPSSMLENLARVQSDRAVVLLLRHSVRDDLPPDDVGYSLPITEIGRRLAVQLGEHFGDQLKTLQTSPLARCIQTAEALGEGAGVDLDVVPDRFLGDPGIFVLSGKHAWINWQDLGHEGVMNHLVTQTTDLPGMARPDEAARFLVRHMLAVAGDFPGIHVFVTHDSLVTATASRLLNQPLGVDDWPLYLEAALFWQDDAGVHTAYRDQKAVHDGQLCGFTESDVIEFARREVAATIGFDSGARFFLAGGAFKSLLTGRPPRDLDLWAPSDLDRNLLVDALKARDAIPLDSTRYADAYELAGRRIEVPHSVTPTTLTERLNRFDIGLSAVGVEHHRDGHWSALIHPLAIESVRRREVLLLKPLVNWKYALASLERMRRYGRDLGFVIPSGEEDEIWRVFESQPEEMRTGMIERYQRSTIGEFAILKELSCRFP